MNSLDSVKRLCEAGCDLFVKSHDGFTAMEYALQRGDNCLGIIKYLHDFGDYKIQPRENGKMSLLHRVCVAKKDIPVASTLEFLINEGEEVNFTEGKGRYVISISHLNTFCTITMKNYFRWPHFCNLEDLFSRHILHNVLRKLLFGTNLIFLRYRLKKPMRSLRRVTLHKMLCKTPE